MRGQLNNRNGTSLPDWMQGRAATGLQNSRYRGDEKFWVERGMLHIPMAVLRHVIPILLCSGAPLQLILEVQQLWKHKICKNCDKQMTQVEQWWCQTCDISQAGHGWPHSIASVAPVGFPSPQSVGIVVSPLPAMRDLSVKQVLSRNVTAVFFRPPLMLFFANQLIVLLL